MISGEVDPLILEFTQFISCIQEGVTITSFEDWVGCPEVPHSFHEVGLACGVCQGLMVIMWLMNRREDSLAVLSAMG